MSTFTQWLIVLLCAACVAARADDAPSPGKLKFDDAKFQQFRPEQHTTTGSVTVAGRRIDYQAIAGTLVVHAKGWDDVPQNANPEEKTPPAEASMFYVAYFAKVAAGAPRPLTFVFNGGPGSATVWLHMGAFGPRRVLTADNGHTPAAPYRLVNNDYSLLDASDLVFIDAPGAGFSRIGGKDREKAFWSVDGDGQAFASFITQFLSQYGRWNSPKYLFGESYGTTRAALLANLLETDRFVDLNGVILLSQILNFDASADAPELNPGVDLPYELALPTYAATAWFHKKLADAPADLGALLTEVEHFAMTDYAQALQAGAALDPGEKLRIAQKLHQYTGLPVDYIEKADLRINVGEFTKTLGTDADLTTGRLDTRFTGPTLDPLSQGAGYDPVIAGVASAYVALFNDYARKVLQFPGDYAFRPFADVGAAWNFQHQPPGQSQPAPQSANVMPDLALAMKYNPQLKVLLNSGYFDLATPFYEGIYEMQHLPIPASLRKNIEFRYYESGHMVYVQEAALKALHENVAGFIRNTSNPESK